MKKVGLFVLGLSFSIKWIPPHRYRFVFFFVFLSLTCCNVFCSRLVAACFVVDLLQRFFCRRLVVAFLSPTCCGG